uniref:Uncharacterized protein n=1 Tax=Xenopus tropicalis TaxID=8364 RepID=A0A1B8Y337_XENTR
MNISAQVVELFGSAPSRNNSAHLGRTRTCRTEGGAVLLSHCYYRGPCATIPLLL